MAREELSKEAKLKLGSFLEGIEPSLGGWEGEHSRRSSVQGPRRSVRLGFSEKPEEGKHGREW